MQQADLAIIGAGPAAYDNAARAAEAGLSVIVIEKSKPGGTCLHAGCIPTKSLCHTAEILEEARHASEAGVNIPTVTLDLAAAVARKDTVVEQLCKGVEGLLSRPGITLLRGEANGISPTSEGITLSVCLNDGGKETVKARKVFVATGSRAKRLPIPGADLPGVVTAEALLSPQEVPARLCVIGGGVIGLEMASVYAAFGSQVTVVEFTPEVLPPFDRDMAKRLRLALRRRGIVFHTGAGAKAVRKTADGYAVDYEEKGKAGTVEADIVLMAVGREPVTDGLGLDAAGIAHTPRGITVDAHMQTGVPGIYAVGDVNGLSLLAHSAAFQGRVALNHILGRDEEIDLTLCPSAVFTLPELAMVGQTEEQLKQAATPYTTHKASYRANGKALAMGAPDGIVKVLTAPDGRLLGAHILGAHAADLVHEAAVAMSAGMTLEALQRTIHAHPTLSEMYLAL